jgi:hypothetical protein
VVEVFTPNYFSPNGGWWGRGGNGSEGCLVQQPHNDPVYTHKVMKACGRSK